MPIDPSLLRTPAVLDAIRGIDGVVTLAAITALTVLVAILIIVARRRATQVTRLPGLKEVTAWQRAASARPVGADTLDDVRIIAQRSAQSSTTEAGSLKVESVAAALQASEDTTALRLVDLRAELHERIDAIQRRLLTTASVGLLLGIVLGLLLASEPSSGAILPG